MSDRDLDETTRPSAPRDDTPVSETGRRVGEHLVEVHDMYRAELDQVRDVLDQLRAGRTTVGEARGDLQRLALLANTWAFGGICQRYCFAITQHHELESGRIFPYLHRRSAALAPVLDRLDEEHRLIHRTIVDIDTALVRLATAPDDLSPIEDAVEALTTIVRSHFAYEERELVGALARWGFYPGQV